MLKASMKFYSTTYKEEGCFDYVERVYYTEKTKIRQIIFTIKGTDKEEEATDYVDNFLENYNNTNLVLNVYNDLAYVEEIEDGFSIEIDIENIEDYDNLLEIKDDYKDLKSAFAQYKDDVKNNKTFEVETQEVAQTENTELVNNTVETIAPVTTTEEVTISENQNPCITEQPQSLSENKEIMSNLLNRTVTIKNSKYIPNYLHNKEGKIIEVINENIVKVQMFYNNEIYKLYVEDLNKEVTISENPKSSITELKLQHRGNSVQNYRIFLEPDKECITENSIIRIDLFNNTQLKNVKELKNWEYKIKDSFKKTFYIIPTKLKNTNLANYI